MFKVGRVIALLVIDAVLVSLSMYVSYLLRFDFHIDPYYKDTLSNVIPAYVIMTLLSYYSVKVYKRLWQYASLEDLLTILKGSIIAAVGFYVLHQFIHYFNSDALVPRSIHVLSMIISFLAVGGSRFFWRVLRDNYRKFQPNHRRLLIVGAGEAGMMVMRELKQARTEYYPVAFIDDNPQKQKLELMGIPVVGVRADIPSAVEKFKIDDIILAIPSSTKAQIAEIIAICKETRCQIKIIPSVKDLIKGSISINMIRDVSVEDLLGREPVQLDLHSISDYLSNKVVLITGAGGSIGSELCRQVAQFKPKKLLLLGRGENSIYEIQNELKSLFPEVITHSIIADIQDKARLDNVFKQFSPNVVFHAAAHKHVPLMESNPIEAVKNNILGTRNVALCAHENRTERFVMISTDKAVNPTNVMGASKNVAEMIVQSLDQISQTRFASVRFGNVLGSRGSVIPIFKKQIEQGGPVTVTHPEMIRYFMTIPEAVQLVIQTGAIADGGEVFILDMGKPVKILDLAKDLIRLSGFEPDKDIPIVFTGIRPGEKLFEELLTAEEGASGTKYDRIYIGIPSQTPYDEVNQMIEQFESLVLNQQWEPTDVKALLRRWVPSYNGIQDRSLHEDIEANKAFQASLEVVASMNGK